MAIYTAPDNLSLLASSAQLQSSYTYTFKYYHHSEFKMSLMRGFSVTRRWSSLCRSKLPVTLSSSDPGITQALINIPKSPPQNTTERRLPKSWYTPTELRKILEDFSTSFSLETLKILVNTDVNREERMKNYNKRRTDIYYNVGVWYHSPLFDSFVYISRKESIIHKTSLYMRGFHAICNSISDFSR